MSNAEKKLKKLDILYIADGNVKQYRHSGNQWGILFYKFKPTFSIPLRNHMKCKLILGKCKLTFTENLYTELALF